MKKFYAFLGLFMFVTTAQASLVGDEMYATWGFDSFVDLPVSFMGGAGPVLWIPEVVVEAQSNKLIIDNVTGPGTGLLAGVTWRFTDIDWNGGPGGISNVLVDTNYIGWDDSFLSFTTDSITVNFLNDVTTGDYTDDLFELTLISAPVPEPSNGMLWMAGLLFLGARSLAVSRSHRTTSNRPSAGLPGPSC